MKSREERIRLTIKRLEKVKWLSEDERVLHATALAETPDERWERNRQFLKSHGLSTRSALKKYALSS
ncbi:MAG: hypothetical protein AAF649_09300 [Verrucomicrobiota bacterium]